MTAFITTLAIGLLACVLSIINMTGNISSLHWYHRHRVTEENRKQFGKLVGAGTLIIGISLILFSILLFIYEQTNLELLSVIGTAELICGIIIGSIISFYAIKKYNGGIF